jgi:tetratricopeptide (TPR) repeat protein
VILHAFVKEILSHAVAHRQRADARRRISSESTIPSDGLTARICAGLLVLAGVVAFSNSLAGPFLFDDNLAIVNNAGIRQLWPLTSVLFAETDTPLAGRPIVGLSFALNYAVGGLAVRGYHVVNIAVHVACALVLFGVVRQTLRVPALKTAFGARSTLLAFATALIWMLHPLNTEAVDFITERTESLMALFYMLTLYAGIRGSGAPPGSHQTGARTESKWLWLSVLSCALGMACKESMATAPLMVVLYDRAFLFDSWKRARRARFGFYLALASTWLVLAVLVSTAPRGASAGFSSSVSPWTYLLNQAPMIVRYLRLTFWPRGFVLNYGPPVPLTLRDVWPEALIVAVLLVIAAISFVRRPKVGFLAAWFFITLAPASSLVPIATEVGAERRMYLPLMAIAAAAVLGCGLLWRYLEQQPTGAARAARPSRVNRVPVAMAILLAVASTVLCAATLKRNGEYSSSLLMAQTMVDRMPSSHTRHILGQELMAVGRHEEASSYFREASAGDPRAHYNLGLELFNHDRFDEALDELQQFVTKEPLVIYVVPARTMIGQIYAKKGQWAQAAAEFRRVLMMDRSKVDVHGLLADALSAQQLFDEAIPEYQQYLQRHPDETGALSSLAVALAARGRLDEAVSMFERVATLDPGNGLAHLNLANALLSRDDFPGASRQAREAVKLLPRNSVAHELLGLSLANQGQLEEAKSELQQAVRLDPANTEARDALNQVLRRANAPGPRR